MADEQDDGSFEARSSRTPSRSEPGREVGRLRADAPNPNLIRLHALHAARGRAGIGVSYESLSRDYSQSNYSSSRLALLDDRDLWRFYQSWFTRDFRKKVHRAGCSRRCCREKSPAFRFGQYALDRRQVRSGALQAARLELDRSDEGSRGVQGSDRAGLTTAPT
jgi:hypothetical protein